MKRYLIPISIVLVLILGVIGGCSHKPEQVHEPTPEQVYEPSSKDALTPKVIEKDVEIKFRHTERDRLSFYLKVGDRVEGEVSLNKDALEPRVFKAMGHFVISEVRDPYGNVVVQTRCLNSYGEHFDNSGFPWGFAFIASTDGEYELRVFFSGQVQSLTPSAHLKITCYEGD